MLLVTSLFKKLDDDFVVHETFRINLHNPTYLEKKLVKPYFLKVLDNYNNAVPIVERINNDKIVGAFFEKSSTKSILEYIIVKELKCEIKSTNYDVLVDMILDYICVVEFDDMQKAYTGSQYVDFINFVSGNHMNKFSAIQPLFIIDPEMLVQYNVRNLNRWLDRYSALIYFEEQDDFKQDSHHRDGFIQMYPLFYIFLERMTSLDKHLFDLVISIDYETSSVSFVQLMAIFELLLSRDPRKKGTNFPISKQLSSKIEIVLLSLLNKNHYHGYSELIRIAHIYRSGIAHGEDNSDKVYDEIQVLKQKYPGKFEETCRKDDLLAWMINQVYPLAIDLLISYGAHRREMILIKNI